ncbi:CaiB/BaiF CoA transferase family protein [Jatrophihabitans sp. DSM 45814]
MARSPNQLLNGLRVLDLSLWQPGHYATQLLADLGAEVIKIEPPGGDRMRPLADRFANFNGRKRSLVLDLKNSDDYATLLDLLADVEVLVENYRPGVAAKLGVDFERLHPIKPELVVCSITGFGQGGPLAAVTGHDANYQAYAGAMSMIDGQPPVPAGLLVGDQGSGLVAAFAILAAVLCARRTGEGEHIDVSMADLLATWVAPLGPVDDRRPTTSQDGVTGEAPAMGLFATADDHWVVLGVFSENHFWDALCSGLGLQQHVGLTMRDREAQATPLRADLTAQIARHTRDELLRNLGAMGVPIAPVLTRSEMLQHDHFRKRGVLTVGPEGYLMVGHPVRYAVHPALPPGSAPRLDEYAQRSSDLPVGDNHELE